MPSQPDTAYFLPYDPTGTLVGNHITNEYHSVTAGQKSIVRCDYGSFFSEGFTINWRGVNDTLHAMYVGVDYTFAEFDAITSAKLGKDVYRAILIINDTLPGIYAVDYHAVGGSDNPHVSNVWMAAFNGDINSQPVSFAAIEGRPDFYPPATHEHDARDVFGAEHVKTIAERLLLRLQRIRTAYSVDGKSSAEAEIGHKLDVFRNTLKTDYLNLRGYISAHIQTAEHLHGYTKEQIGLGNVSDGDFVPANDQNNQPLPVYAHPLAVATALQTLPDPVSSNHATRTDNPHADTKNSVGFGSIINAGFYETYTPGDWQTLLAVNATKKYIAPYVAVNALSQALDANYQSNWVTPVSALTAPNGQLTLVSTQISDATTAVANAVTAISQANTAISAALVQVGTAEAKNRRFKILNLNAHLAEQLKAIASFDYGRAAIGSGVSRDGLYPVPEKIPNLALWLDFSYYLNTYETDSQGAKRLMRIVDRSSAARVFSAQSHATAPRMAMSADVSDGNIGMTKNEVAHFVTGTNMQQIFGSAFALQAGMTVIAMIRTSDAVLPLSLLVNSQATPLASIIAQPAAGVALEVGTPTWKALKSAPATGDANKSAIVVASVSDVAESECWFASSKAIPKQQYPRGTNTPVSPWLADYARTASLTVIGSATSDQAGEVAHLLAFNRQLSMKEVEAVVDYLRLAETNNQALSVDYSAGLAF